GVIAGDFKSGAITVGLVQSLGLQFYASTSAINDASPWADVQQVTYELRDPAPRSRTGGKDLIRTVARNLLSTSGPDTDERWLLGSVQALDFACYDGATWRDWNTTLGDTNLPAAVRVH